MGWITRSCPRKSRLDKELVLRWSHQQGNSDPTSSPYMRVPRCRYTCLLGIVFLWQNRNPQGNNIPRCTFHHTLQKYVLCLPSQSNQGSTALCKWLHSAPQ